MVRLLEDLVVLGVSDFVLNHCRNVRPRGCGTTVAESIRQGFGSAQNEDTGCKNLEEKLQL